MKYCRKFVRNIVLVSALSGAIAGLAVVVGAKVAESDAVKSVCRKSVESAKQASATAKAKAVSVAALVKDKANALVASVKPAKFDLTEPDDDTTGEADV